MCWKMADGFQNQEVKLEHLRKQLSVAVRSIQWSYAIFWSLSTRQQGVLEWKDGYYNGDIKTRKTVQTIEPNADKMCLRRSEQLRELYQSLLEGKTDQQAKMPSTALSPEDLTDAEWYYLVCMSFIFKPGQSLPGRALANGQSIWLCNAQYADSKVFSRSLLAKSASIQTVVCFPHVGGVIELGVTELVMEDPSLIQHIKASLLELSKPICSEKSPSVSCNADDDKEPMFAKVDHEIVETMILENFYSPSEEIKFDQDGVNELHGNVHEEFIVCSPDECSTGCGHNHRTEDSFMLEGINGAASQVQSWHFMDDDFSNGVQGSTSDCISQAFVSQEKGISSLMVEKKSNPQLKEHQECNHTNLSSLDLVTADDLHYTRTLSAVFKNSNQLIKNPSFLGCSCKSCFCSWKKGGMINSPWRKEQQIILKKILFAVPLMHCGNSPSSQKETSRQDILCKLGTDNIFLKRCLSDTRAENEKYLVLRSMVPAVSEIDKASILGDTIEYLKELEARIEELESCLDLIEYDTEGRRRHQDMLEQTSDNYDVPKIENGKKSWINKRKASDMDETELLLDEIVPKGGFPLNMKVDVKESEVLIEMRCPWREYLLVDIMDALNNVHLDAHTIQSSTLDGILILTLKSQFRGTAVASVGMIKQALWRIIGTY